jgi:hypothetical protein
VLPFLQLHGSDLALEAQRPDHGRKRARFPLVRLLERLDLPDRRVLRVFGGDVEMTALGADTAMNAGFHPKGAQRTDLAGKTPHRTGDLIGRR